MRALFYIFFALGLLSGPAIAADKTKPIEVEVKTARVGKTLILDFMGNKRAVHRWRLVEERSPGLKLVEVDEIGWIISSDPTASIYENLDTMRFRVAPKKAGKAELTFEHNYRGWKGKYYVKYKTIEILIDPAA